MYLDCSAQIDICILVNAGTVSVVATVDILCIKMIFYKRILIWVCTTIACTHEGIVACTGIFWSSKLKFPSTSDNYLNAGKYKRKTN